MNIALKKNGLQLALNEEHALQLVPKRIEAPEGFVAVGIRVVNKNGCPIGSPQEEGK